MTDKIILDLPMPPSTNQIWRSNRGRVHRSNAYTSWLKIAGAEWLTQKKGQPKSIPGYFRAYFTLDEKSVRKGSDLDNRTKASLDFCKAHGVISDDKLCRLMIHRWGTSKDAPKGIRIVLRKFVAPSRSLPRRLLDRPCGNDH